MHQWEAKVKWSDGLSTKHRYASLDDALVRLRVMNTIHEAPFIVEIYLEQVTTGTAGDVGQQQGDDPTQG